MVDRKEVSRQDSREADKAALEKSLDGLIWGPPNEWTTDELDPRTRRHGRWAYESGWDAALRYERAAKAQDSRERPVVLPELPFEAEMALSKDGLAEFSRSYIDEMRTSAVLADRAAEAQDSRERPVVLPKLTLPHLGMVRGPWPNEQRAWSENHVYDYATVAVLDDRAAEAQRPSVAGADDEAAWPSHIGYVAKTAGGHERVYTETDVRAMLAATPRPPASTSVAGADDELLYVEAALLGRGDTDLADRIRRVRKATPRPPAAADEREALDTNYQPNGAIDAALHWLNVALKAFAWDSDQAEAARQAVADASKERARLLDAARPHPVAPAATQDDREWTGRIRIKEMSDEYRRGVEDGKAASAQLPAGQAVGTVEWIDGLPCIRGLDDDESVMLEEGTYLWTRPYLQAELDLADAQARLLHADLIRANPELAATSCPPAAADEREETWNETLNRDVDELLAQAPALIASRSHPVAPAMRKLYPEGIKPAGMNDNEWERNRDVMVPVAPAVTQDELIEKIIVEVTSTTLSSTAFAHRLRHILLKHIAASSQLPAGQAVALYRHRKSGKDYRLLLIATPENEPEARDAIYQSVETGIVWSRSKYQFDEKFDALGVIATPADGDITVNAAHLDSFVKDNLAASRAAGWNDAIEAVRSVLDGEDMWGPLRAKIKEAIHALTPPAVDPAPAQPIAPTLPPITYGEATERLASIMLAQKSAPTEVATTTAIINAYLMGRKDGFAAAPTMAAFDAAVAQPTTD